MRRPFFRSILLKYIAPYWGGYKFIRKLIGGHWEYWYIEAPIYGWVWIPTKQCIILGARPNSQMLYCGNCEDYDQPLLLDQIRNRKK